MHGSSSVPQDLLAEIRKYGGDMKETYGVPVEEIQEAIKFGVRKINIDTDIRLAMTAAIRRFFAENPSKFDPREYLKPAREAAKTDLPAALPAVRLRRAGQQDPRGFAFDDDRALSQGRTRADGRLSHAQWAGRVVNVPWACTDIRSMRECPLRPFPSLLPVLPA